MHLTRRMTTTALAGGLILAAPLAAGPIVTGASAGPAAAGAATAATPVASGAAVTHRELEGTVLSVNRTARTFRLRDAERGTFTIRVTSSTRYERVSGLAGLRAGMSRIEVDVRRSAGRWLAVEVERSGRDGRHGGRADDDDHRGRGGDDHDDD